MISAIIMGVLYLFIGLSSDTNNLEKQILIEKKEHPREKRDSFEEKGLHYSNVVGKLPLWLNGRFIHISPAQYTLGDEKIWHFFDGFGLLTSYTFSGDKIGVCSRLLKTDQLKASLSEGKINLLGFAENFGEFFPLRTTSDGQKACTSNANINVMRLGEHYLALGEIPMPVEFNPETLATEGMFDYADDLPKKDAWESAHPKKDPETGIVYNIMYGFGFMSDLIIYKFNEKTLSREKIASHHVSYASYVHDFSITKRFIVIVAYPLVVNPWDLNGIREKSTESSFIGAFKWKPDQGTIVSVFDKNDGSLVQEFKLPPFFALHHVNAYENANGQIALSLLAYDDPKIILDLALFPDGNISPSNIRTITLDFQSKKASLKTVSNISCDFPVVPDKLLGREFRYFYAVCFNNCDDKRNGLMKYDLLQGKQQIFYRQGLLFGEPVFVPKPDGRSEDDGVLLVVGRNDEGYSLFVIDASTMEELAHASFKGAAATQLHGHYFGKKPV